MSRESIEEFPGVVPLGRLRRQTLKGFYESESEGIPRCESDGEFRLKRSLGYGFFDIVEQLQRGQGTAFSLDRQNSLRSTGEFGGNAKTADTLLWTDRGAKRDCKPSASPRAKRRRGRFGRR
jgi:hypothetical protein